MHIYTQPLNSCHTDATDQTSDWAPSGAQEGQVVPAQSHPAGAATENSTARAQGVQTQPLPQVTHWTQTATASGHQVPVQN